MSEAPATRAVGASFAATPQIEVRGLKHRYRTGDGGYVDALDDVSFVVPAGDVLTVVGPSGCGKATLVHLIAGLIRPLAGPMLVDGQAVGRPSLGRRPDQDHAPGGAAANLDADLEDDPLRRPQRGRGGLPRRPCARADAAAGPRQEPGRGPAAPARAVLGRAVGAAALSRGPRAG